MLKIAFIINGSRKLTDNVNELIQHCKLHPELDVYQFVTNKQKDAIQFAKACTEKQFEALIAVGGDGTINEVLNGMMQVPIEQPILGVIPTGTGNDFVKGIDAKWNLEAFVPALIEKKTRTIDIAKLVTNNKNYYFLNIADIGFGGKVVQVLEKQRKFIGGKASYGLAILRTFLGFRKPTMSIQTEDFNYQGPTMMVSICNGSVFGNGLIINPNAVMNDGFLNITLLRKVSILNYIQNLGKLKRGELIIHPEVTYLTAKNIEIRVIKGKAQTEMDGEYVESGNLTISVLEGALKLLKLD